MTSKYIKSIHAACIASIFCVGMYAAIHIKNTYRNELLESPIAQRIIPLYRSLRKLPDFIFMPWSAFTKSDLETFEITISPKKIVRMNSVLPKVPFNSSMDEESKLWVSGNFRTADYEDNVKIRYRGNLATHWNAYQKSYSIKFPKNHLFRGMRKMALVIPSKRRYIAMSLNDYRAEKLDLIHPDESLVRLDLNGTDTGVLLAFEGWGQEWIEKMPISSLSTLYGVNEGKTLYRERWDSWNSDEPIDFTPLETLEEIIDHASDEDFARLIPSLVDLEQWYKWDIMKILASGYHVSSETAFGENNLVLLFDRNEGLFKPIPYNTGIYTPSNRKILGRDRVAVYPTRLYQRILSVPEFRARRDELFHTYLANERADDLAYLDWWQKTYNDEFLLDNAKNDNHFMYLSKIKENVQAVADYFDDPYDMLSETFSPPVLIKNDLDIPETFMHLSSSVKTARETAAAFTFIIERDGQLRIPRGTYLIDTTVIIPHNTRLTIDPGTTLLMSSDVSLISYSPVEAQGDRYNPITIKNAAKSWGVFAIINTTNTSTLSYIHLTHGGEDTVNGAYFSGTLSIHNSVSILDHITVTNAHGDDGINVKGSYMEITNSILLDNSSDGIDLDFIDPHSVFSNNTLKNNKGDAIDISWSNITIDNNTIIKCGDKGISVGEQSRPIITHNKISGCAVGIAVKDSSIATITNNTLIDNTTALTAYQKKPYFGGGTIFANNNHITKYEQLTFIDELSKIDIVD